MSGTQAYQWLAPVTGPAGIDWVTAAWAVVISQRIGVWYMGSTEEDEIPTTMSQRRTSRSAGTWILALILAALTIPSFILSGSPLPVVSSETVSSFNVGCVLPTQFKDNTPSINDYIDASVALSSKVSGTKLLLWPEARFRTRPFIIMGHTGGVSFEETIIDAGGRTISRMGMALISGEGVHEPIYYKRFLVPIAESFALAPGTSPPSIFTLPLRDPDHSKKPKWGDRTIDVTASVCLDFAMPGPFRDLESKPTLILAPARTWDPAIGHRMWAEVNQRAAEIGSLALWCDGGKGGVSGVAGGGYNEIFQVGGGSWYRAVGIPYPSDRIRKFYARIGDASVVFASWFFLFGSIVFRMTASRLKKTQLYAMAVKFYDWAIRTRPIDLQHPTTGQSSLLPSRSARSLYGPVSSTRSNLPSDPVRRPFLSPSLGSFQFITSDDLPIPLDDSPKIPRLLPPSSPLDVSAVPLKGPSHSKENRPAHKSSESDSPSVCKADVQPTAKPLLAVSSNAHSDPAAFVPSIPDFEPGLPPIPEDLRASLNSIHMDFTGKQAAEVVDFGGEVDYSGHRWFQDAPPKQPPAQQSVGTPYVPLPGVIEQNEAFEFALSAAPNVLYARYKQYGQLGVLAWCSEFGELIDNLKDLGFKGNMFVATRTQALRTCEELLKLTKHSLDLKMQIIVMYLSSQVARLRRFLDGDKTWDDYPEPQFPDYKKYSNLAGEFA
ncbi:Apolipo n-acyltransferase [Mycena venus]|uniref:Apolipo n-acyltransferase n=1 Tax=Mycena venus TaxID=2733690 RepID=A0A8H6XUW8_9AGAR|nr:Apolipo n-acyltransferase [Mycena venus]